MKKGRICAVEYLSQTDDKKRIAEGMELFRTKGLAMGAEGFEVWDQTRFVYRFALDDAVKAAPVADGRKEPVSWLQRLARRFTLRRALLGSCASLASPFGVGRVTHAVAGA